VRWLLVAAAVALAAIVVVAALGRWERRRYVDRELRGLERVARLVGPLDQRSLVGYRVLPQFDCLVYRRGQNLLALELCVDRAGRVVEAADRLTGQTYYSLRADPADSTLRVDRAEVDRLLRRMEAATAG
jgi:hypothetical protein